MLVQASQQRALALAELLERVLGLLVWSPQAEWLVSEPQERDREQARVLERGQLAPDSQVSGWQALEQEV